MVEDEQRSGRKNNYYFSDQSSMRTVGSAASRGGPREAPVTAIRKWVFTVKTPKVSLSLR